MFRPYFLRILLFAGHGGRVGHGATKHRRFAAAEDVGSLRCCAGNVDTDENLEEVLRFDPTEGEFSDRWESDMAGSAQHGTGAGWVALGSCDHLTCPHVPFGPSKRGSAE